MANREVNLTKRVHVGNNRWRYYPVALSANGRVQPDVVVVDGHEERRPESAYSIEWYKGCKLVRLSVGKNAQAFTLVTVGLRDPETSFGPPIPRA